MAVIIKSIIFHIRVARMAIFEWDDSLSIGNDKIDGQHKELIKRIDHLAQHILEKRGREKTNNTLRFMLDYSEDHFSTEEELMVMVELAHSAY